MILRFCLKYTLYTFTDTSKFIIIKHILYLFYLCIHIRIYIFRIVFRLFAINPNLKSKNVLTEIKAKFPSTHWSAGQLRVESNQLILNLTFQANIHIRRHSVHQQGLKPLWKVNNTAPCWLTIIILLNLQTH